MDVHALLRVQCRTRPKVNRFHLTECLRFVVGRLVEGMVSGDIAILSVLNSPWPP